MPCGRFNPGLAGLWALGGKQVQHDAHVPSQQHRQTRCPDCGWRIVADFDWCPQCGLRLKPWQCDYCHRVVPFSLQSCPGCGAPNHLSKAG